jgi:Tfp pilus assembly protein PilN
MSAIQFNLLPDIKLKYIEAQRSRNLVFGVALLVSAAAIVGFLIMLFTVEVVQKKQLDNANKAVTSASQQLQGISDLDKVLTVQNQLQTLTSLHASKHITSRLFSYLPEVTPTDVNISSVNLDTTNNTLAITGTADSQLSVNTFIDTLKFTTYKANSQDSEHVAFPSVVEDSFSFDQGKASFSLTVGYDPVLFSNTTGQTPQLIIHNQVTTRSVLEDPSNVLFNGQPNGQTQAGSQ